MWDVLWSLLLLESIEEGALLALISVVLYSLCCFWIYKIIEYSMIHRKYLKRNVLIFPELNSVLFVWKILILSVFKVQYLADVLHAHEFYPLKIEINTNLVKFPNCKFFSSEKLHYIGVDLNDF